MSARITTKTAYGLSPPLDGTSNLTGFLDLPADDASYWVK